MRKFVFIAAAATLAFVVPASAQGVSIGVDGVGVRAGTDRHHERNSRAQYRDSRDRDVVVIKRKRQIERDRDFDDRRSRKTVIIER